MITAGQLETPIDVARIREDFPILATRVHDDRPLAFLDNAASSQRPQQVIRWQKHDEQLLLRSVSYSSVTTSCRAPAGRLCASSAA